MKKFFYSLIFNILMISESFARGGGGGSGGGGGGGGGGSSGGSSSGSGGSGDWGIPLIIFGVIFLGVIGFAIASFIIGRAKRKKAIEESEKTIEKVSETDKMWDEELMRKRVEEVFYAFQKDWSDFNVDKMSKYLTENYHKRMVLEMNVLKNEKRQNLMENVQLSSTTIIGARDAVDNRLDNFTAEVKAMADDKLIDTETSLELYKDSSPWTEYWTFKKDKNQWKLDIIGQSTEDPSKKVPAIVDFSQKNNFYYDPDFGWLMMPNKGVIFSKSNFKTSDINNHVIGWYRDKIVEFYTFQATPGDDDSAGSPVFVVAQAILPINYKDILVKKKKLFNFSPKGLRKIELESVDFNKKFCLWADPQDSVSSFELLTPNFMEKIYALPFDTNIEVVGSFLYFYTKDVKKASYNKMLEILSWAFDEMKM